MLSFVRACAFLFAVIPIALAADDSAPLATLRELSEISREEADRRRPVHVSCVVTSAEPDWNTFRTVNGPHLSNSTTRLSCLVNWPSVIRSNLQVPHGLVATGRQFMPTKF